MASPKVIIVRHNAAHSRLKLLSAMELERLPAFQSRENVTWQSIVDTSTHSTHNNPQKFLIFVDFLDEN